MEVLIEAVKELNSVLRNFTVGTEPCTQSIDCEDFDKLEKAFNVKKGELYLNAAYKEDLSTGNSRVTSYNSPEAIQDYLKEKYMKECRDLALRRVVEMLSLENAEIDDNGKYGEIKRRLMKLSQGLLDISEEIDPGNQKLYDTLVAKEMNLLELMYKYQDASSRLREKRVGSPDTAAIDERLEHRKKSVLEKVNFMKRLTVNVIGMSGIKLSENPDMVTLLIDSCQPIKYEDIDKL